MVCGIEQAYGANNERSKLSLVSVDFLPRVLRLANLHVACETIDRRAVFVAKTSM